jgi:2-dehydropantoate 2-reductase
MKICVYGAGSIGCYLGGRLVAAGYDIDFIVRPKIQQATSNLRFNCFRLHRIQANISVNQLQMSIDPM